MIGLDNPDEVLQWIQDRITCHIPDKHTDPELVTRYQMHRCSGYCKRVVVCLSQDVGLTFLGHHVRLLKLNSVSEGLKSHNKIYQLAQSQRSGSMTTIHSCYCSQH